MSILDNATGFFLDTVGDGSGSTLMNVDGSVTPVEFKAIVPANAVFVATGLIQYLKENDIAPTGVDGSIPYASGNAPLANGVEVEVIRSNGDVLDLLAGVPLKWFGEWAQHGSLIAGYDFRDRSVTDALSVNWRFDPPKRLGSGDTFLVRVNDDLTFIEEARTKLDGYFEQPFVF